MIQQHEQQFSVSLMCRLLTVSRSGCYQWKNRRPSERQQTHAVLVVEVKRVFEDEKALIGSPRIAKRLNGEGHRASPHAIAKIMKIQGWRAKAARKYKAIHSDPEVLATETANSLSASHRPSAVKR
ncbi:Mobile element protein [Methylomonas albis]|uniref:IS3 family transposase n=1 Tax=Methylomonas albis TaxID=1854563 RepID=A0ABR9D0Z3_9GAMM|nr:IS3 family transposase [Methylomonas albis]MBD9356685.1 IS3 family transposase [Methylomonas albis]CAD6879829.1 Mobile element protein [Methylomonas albis]